MPNGTCPHCGQPLREQRGGVFMTPLKVALFDAIAAGGDLGTNVAELGRLDIWRDRKPVKRDTIKAHVWQINEALALTPWRIVYFDKAYVLVRKAATVRVA